MIELELDDIESLDCPVCGSTMIPLELSKENTIHHFVCSDEHKWGCSIRMKLEDIKIK